MKRGLKLMAESTSLCTIVRRARLPDEEGTETTASGWAAAPHCGQSRARLPDEEGTETC